MDSPTSTVSIDSFASIASSSGRGDDAATAAAVDGAAAATAAPVDGAAAAATAAPVDGAAAAATGGGDNAETNAQIAAPRVLFFPFRHLNLCKEMVPGVHLT